MEEWIRESAARRAAAVRVLEERARASRAAEEPRAPLKAVVDVWGYRSPLEAGSKFQAKARVKAFGGESLEGVSIKVVDPSTGKVVGRTDAGTPSDAANGVLEGTLELAAPSDPGFYKWVVVADADGRPDIIAQKKMPFSVVPAAGRRVTVRCVDDKSGRPVPGVTAFFYNDRLERTSPLRADGGADGRVVMDIAADSSYKVEVVAEDYCQAFSSIPQQAPGEGDVYEVPMRNKFNVKMRTAYF